MARYYIGTSGWHYDDWRSRFYPDDLPRDKWLEFYSRHFNTLELNNSFYRLPTEAAFKNWYETSPPGFIFSVKVSRFITHIKRLKNCEEASRNFMSKASLLQEKLGPLLYQLPPGMLRNDDVLKIFLDMLPSGYRHVFEFRHESWFAEDVYRILREYRAGFCTYDMPGLTSPLVVTADFAYIRFHGHEGLYSSDYSDAELQAWAEKIRSLAGQMESIYVYFNNDVAGFAIKNARTLKSLLEGG